MCFCLVLLDSHDFLDCGSDVEQLHVFAELAAFDLGVVQKVVHQVFHQLRG